MTPEGSLCDYSQFICGGECISFAYLCDGVQNCPDGEDESQCGKIVQALQSIFFFSFTYPLIIGVCSLSKWIGHTRARR